MGLQWIVVGTVDFFFFSEMKGTYRTILGPVFFCVLLTSVLLDKVLVRKSVGVDSCGGDVAVFVFDINQPSMPTPFYSVLEYVSAFMALSTVFYSINSPDNSPLSHSALPVLFFPHWFIQLYISLLKSSSALM